MADIQAGSPPKASQQGDGWVVRLGAWLGAGSGGSQWESESESESEEEPEEGAGPWWGVDRSAQCNFEEHEYGHCDEVGSSFDNDCSSGGAVPPSPPAPPQLPAACDLPQAAVPLTAAEAAELRALGLSPPPSTSDLRNLPAPLSGGSDNGQCSIGSVSGGSCERGGGRSALAPIGNNSWSTLATLT